jgi:uncharacterized paraquat-inducible protein A
MALVPCKVCGTLNSEHAEICLSCEFPTKGRSKKQVWQWFALAMALLIAPIGLYALDNVRTSLSAPHTQKAR